MSLALVKPFVNPLECELDAVRWDHEEDKYPKPFHGKLGDLVPPHVILEHKDGTYNSPAFSPATYLPGTTRKKVNVASITALVVDLDDVKEGGITLVQDRLAGRAALYYTTHSHMGTKADGTPKGERWRVILPMTRPVDVTEFVKLWPMVNEKWFDTTVDDSTKDASRLFFLPACPAERLALARYEVFEGIVTDPDDFILAEGNRDTGLTKIAGRLKHKGMEGEPLRAELHRINKENSTGEPLEAWQVDKIYESSKSWAPGVRPILDENGVPVPISPALDLPVNDKGKVVYSPAVLERILTQDGDYKGHLRLNLVTGRKLCRGKVLDDAAILDMRNRITEKYSVKIPKEDIFDMLLVVCTKNGFDPIQDYLNGLVWDGTPRLNAGALKYFGAPSDLESMYLRMWMIGAVARAMVPGCKMDNALVLQGGTQGKAKSTALAVLAGEEYFSDSALDLKNKDSYQGMKGKWVWEWSELETKFKRSDRSEIKAFLSSRVDTYRPSYGREVIDVLRRCVVASSTNEDHFLFDDTGNRRFWVLRCGDIAIDALREDRDQLWAEAVSRYRICASAEFRRPDGPGERWWTTLEEQAKGEDHATQFAEENPWRDKVEKAITEQKCTSAWDGWVDQALMYERCGESWTSAQPSTRRHINHVLRELGFSSASRRIDGVKRKGYFQAIR